MANFAQLGIQIDSKQAEDAARDLDNLAAAGARAEKATDKLSKTTTDWAAEQQKANARAREMEQADSRRAASAQKANSTIKDQQQELSKLIGQINPAVAALERLDEQERKLAQFRRQGLVDSDTFADYNQRLAQQRTALTQVSGAANQAGMSQRAYSAAMRNVPAQITDITTSLIGGQPAYLVAIQQGGQLKDMFGGIVPAARALATSLVSMINPWTLFAAALGVAAYASYDAAKAIERLSIASAKGDGLAGTAQQLGNLANSLNALDGISIGNAEDAIARLAAGGKLTGENLDLAAEASARWASVTGESVDSVASKFEAIGKDPLQAIESGQIRVTEAQYKQVKALVDTGDQQSAVNELTRIYFDNVNSNSATVESNLTNISRAWRDIKDSTGEAFREAGKFFDFFVGASRQAASNSSWWQNFIPAAGLYNQFSAMRNLQPNQPMSAATSRGPLYDPEADKRQKEAAKAAADAASAWDRVLASTDKEIQKRLEIQRIREAGKAAGQSEESIQKQIDAYTNSIAKSSASSVSSARARRVEITEEQKAAQTLARNYESITAQIERQIALQQDNSQLARVNYEISSGNLRGLAQPDQDKLRNLAGVADIESDYAALYSGMDALQVKGKETTSILGEYGVQAARNMQTAFADFLFDPFSDGLDGMLKGFLKTLQRMAAEAAASQIFQLIGSAASSYSGQGAGWVNAIGSILSNGKSEGGYTGHGGKYEPAGIVHRGEVVWSQADVKAVGGPKMANAMRPTAGYANGGIVGGGASPASSNSSPTFEININMEGGTVTSQTQNGSASQDGMQLVNMIEAACSQWWVKQNRTGGAVYKTLRGIG